MLYKSLLEPLSIRYHYPYPFGTNTFTNVFVNDDDFAVGKLKIFFWDQEPFDLGSYSELIRSYDSSNKHIFTDGTILAFSDICKSTSPFQLKWYYFFHGFAALDWFRDARYLPNLNNNFTKLFITLNRLVTKERSYRLSFVANLANKNLIEHGLVSCSLNDSYGGSWKNEVNNSQSKLTQQQKILITDVFSNIPDNLVLDKKIVPGHASADFGSNENELFQSAFLHVITETIFYKKTLHLTEKSFRPIAVCRPFVLLGASGNLAYLKSYGFETFNQWWDESYDSEIDPVQRQAKVVKIIEDLSKLSLTDLQDMYQEMLPIVKHNYNHFYTDFKKIIVNELVDNFVQTVNLHNSQNNGHYYDLNSLDIPTIKNRLAQ